MISETLAAWLNEKVAIQAEEEKEARVEKLEVDLAEAQKRIAELEDSLLESESESHMAKLSVRGLIKTIEEQNRVYENLKASVDFITLFSARNLDMAGFDEETKTELANIASRFR